MMARRLFFTLLASLLMTTTAFAADTEATVDCTEFQQSQVLSDNLVLDYLVTDDVLTGRLTLAREAWLSFGVTSSPFGFMFPANVLIARIDDDVAKYSMSSRLQSGIVRLDDSRQTLMNATMDQPGDGTTVVTFSKILVEDNEIDIEIDGEASNMFIFAYGTSNVYGQHNTRDRGALRMTLTPCGSGIAAPSAEAIDGPGDFQDLWTAHGILAAIAWGVLAPLAIASSLLKIFFPKGGLWYKCHFYLNLTTLVLTLISFALAVAAVDKGTQKGASANHFSGVAHRYIGLVITIIIGLQVIGGWCRPNGPQKLDSGVMEEKKPKRFAWEIIHKGAGFGLLAITWWQVHDGISLYSVRFGTTTDYIAIFWGITGSIAGITALLWVYSRFSAEGKDVEATAHTAGEVDENDEAAA